MASGSWVPCSLVVVSAGRCGGAGVRTALCDVLHQASASLLESSGALDGDDGDLVAGRHFAWVLGCLVGFRRCYFTLIALLLLASFVRTFVRVLSS